MLRIFLVPSPGPAPLSWILAEEGLILSLLIPTLHLPQGPTASSKSKKTEPQWEEMKDHTPHLYLPPPGLRSLLEPVSSLKDRGPRGRNLRKQKWRWGARGEGREAGPPPLQRLAFDAGAAETSPVPEAQGQTDKHRWRRVSAAFIYGPGDRPSPVSESLIYQAEETSHSLATLFPPA